MGLALCCVLATLGYWWLFRGRVSYVDFQGWLPVLLWCSLVALHLLAALLTYISRHTSPGARRLLMSGYGTALILHTWTALDYTGKDEQWLRTGQAILHPKNAKLHDYLDSLERSSINSLERSSINSLERSSKNSLERSSINSLERSSINSLERSSINSLEQDINTPEETLQVLLSNGAQAHSWRGDWALWKVLGKPKLVEQLLAHGANPDSYSRSGTSRHQFKYWVDGPLERLFLQRDQRHTPLCKLLETHTPPHQQTQANQFPTQHRVVQLLLEHGAKANQICRFRTPLSPLGYALLSRDLELVESLVNHGARLQTDTDRDFAYVALENSAANGQLQPLYVRVLPVAQHQQTYARALTAAIRQHQNAGARFLLAEGARLQRPDEVLFVMAQARRKRMPVDLGLIDTLVELGADINHRSGRSPSALGKAIQQKDLELTRHLLGLGANIHQTNIRYGTLHALFAMPSPIREQFAQLLLDAGADPERRDSQGHTFLMRSVYTNNLELTKMALAAGAHTRPENQPQHPRQSSPRSSPQSRTKKSLTTLALQYADDEILAALNIDQPRPGPDPNKLTWAARYGTVAEVKSLVAAGYKVNALDRTGATALERAARKGREDICQYLLSAGADPNLWIADGSKLISANRAGSIASVRRLRGLNKEDNAGFSLLASAALAGKTSLVSILIQWGADPNAVAATREDQILHLVAQAGVKRGEVTRALIQGGAAANAANAAGYTPLTLAARHRAIHMIKVLHASGVDINQADAQGRTAMSETLRAGSVLEHIQILLQLGAVPAQEDLAYARRKAGPSTWALLAR